MRRLSFVHRFVFVCALALLGSVAPGAEPNASKPTGRFLFQPQWLWAGTSESTLQGTGFLIKHAEKIYGVTSIHFLDFNAGGLTMATWCDLRDGSPVVTFRASVGIPDRTSIERLSDVRHDFLVLVAPELKEECSQLEIEFVERYAADTRFWLPNKNAAAPDGYSWVDGVLEQDAGNYLKIRLRQSITVESQSGSPVLNAATGKVAGLIYGAEESGGYVTLICCPARSLVRWLRRPAAAVSLTRSVRKS